MPKENPNADVVFGTDIGQKYRAHGYLTLTVICYKDSGGGAIWKAGDQDQIHKVLIALNQPGRGKGDLINWDYAHQ